MLATYFVEASKYLSAGLLLLVFTASQLSYAEQADDEGASEIIGVVAEKPSEGLFVKIESGYMVPYSAIVPGTDVSFDMVPIPGGRFLLGSPDSEEERSENEGPQIEVEIAPFWMGKHEVTWQEYKAFMGLYTPLKDLQALRNQKNDEKVLKSVASFKTLKSLITSEILDVDAITVPTPLYEPDITFELGEEPKQPASTMSPYAAKQYTKWLSLCFGHDFRLPSEAEWEYASRAGATTAYFFGNDPEQLGKYAWFYDNADETTHLVGEKAANPWGLHDIYGNVAEWTLDQMADSGYDHMEKGKVHSVHDAVRWPTELFPRTVRGGHYDDEAAGCRSAARVGSERAWRDTDPNLPKSPWWLTDYPAHGVGFRLLRPLKQMTQDERTKVWSATVEELKIDIEIRLEEGRGVKENVSLEFPKVMQQLNRYSK